VADGYGADPPYVPDREVFGAYTHEEIWDLVHEALDPASLGQVADAWRGNADLVYEAFRTFSDAVHREFADWTGHTATAALEATREFIGRGTHIHDVCTAVYVLMSANADAAQAVRDALASPPQPYQPLDDPAAEAVHGGRRRMEYDVSAASALADARDTMTRVYNSTLPASGDRVPRFTPPPPDPSGGLG
jgi:hypothetical protein